MGEGMGEGETSIKVSKVAGERLELLAQEQSTTVRALVEELAAERFTRAELAERGENARAYLRDHMGVELTESDEESGRRLLSVIEARSVRHRGAGG
ncbi:hypothetical protein AB0O07_28405 [Streptomyces sp. NPDC093085]|uniref:hypothetical protein n=1 Tax=Streptomyces sp. NPDC093085 TaxID=3155068 RepID=UPI00342F06A1